MSSCEVTVVLDGPGQDVVAGSDVTGAVAVTVGEQTEPANLCIRQIWRAHGKGNTHEVVVEERIELLPRLTPGSPHNVPFRFRAPDSPVTYHGHLVNVDHYVSARVNKPWAKDAVAEADYLVVPGPASAEAYRLGKLAAKAGGGTGKKGPGCLTVVFWILSPLFAVMLLVLIAVLLPILAVVGIVVLVKRALAEKRLGQVTAELGAQVVEEPGARKRPDGWLARKLRRTGSRTYVVAPGETVSAILRFTPPADVTLNGARLDVAATELATSGSGTDATTHRHVVWSHAVTLLDRQPLMRGVPVDVAVPLELPWLGVYSLDAPSNKISWTASFRVDVPGWPDWEHEDELRMIPPR